MHSDQHTSSTLVPQVATHSSHRANCTSYRPSVYFDFLWHELVVDSVYVAPIPVLFCKLSFRGCRLHLGHLKQLRLGFDRTERKGTTNGLEMTLETGDEMTRAGLVTTNASRWIRLTQNRKTL